MMARGIIKIGLITKRDCERQEDSKNVFLPQQPLRWVRACDGATLPAAMGQKGDEDGVPGLLRTFSAMIRLFVRFPLRPALRLLVLLHAFLLLLGYLPIHLLLLLVRLPGLACIFFDTHALSFSRYRPCNTQGDQQCQNSNSFHSEFRF